MKDFDCVAISYEKVFDTVKDLKTELARRVQEYSFGVETRANHSGAKYKQAAAQFARKINQLECDYSGKVHEVASLITRLGGEGWQENPKILNLWHRMAGVVSLFSEHPTKKNTMLAIGKDNELQAFGANRVPKGIQKHGSYYAKGERKDFIVCAEQTMLADFLGIKVHQTFIKRLSSGQRKALVRANIQAFRDDILIIGRNTESLRESTFIITSPPCPPCRDAIISVRPKEVYADSRSGINYTREVDFSAARAVFAGQGIPLKDLAL